MVIISINAFHEVLAGPATIIIDNQSEIGGGYFPPVGFAANRNSQ